MGTQDSVGGFPLPDGKVMRGAVGIAANPFSADITMTNVLFDLYVQQPLKYTFSSGLWTSGKDVSCPSSTYFARTGTRPGMHLYPMLCPNKKCDQRLSQLATVTL